MTPCTDVSACWRRRAGVYGFSRRRKSDGGRRRRAVGASKLGQSNATPILPSSRENAERRERLNNRHGR
jgi:hypothetical protein